LDVVVNPPRQGEPSYESFMAEKKAVLDSLAKRAEMVSATFNSVPGIKCNPVQGAMYCFPQVSLILFSYFSASCQLLTQIIWFSNYFFNSYSFTLPSSVF
jgi:aspartate/methionine/tyrosine aminotransferase